MKRFFEQGHSAQIGMREMNSPKRLRGSRSRAAPHKTCIGTDHRVAPAHHVQAIDKRSYISVRPREIGKRDIRPTLPPNRKQSRVGFLSVRVAQRIIVGEYGWTSIEASLMRSDYVTQTLLALIQHVIPRERKAPVFRTIPQGQISHHPCAVLKIRNMRGRRFSIGSD